MRFTAHARSMEPDRGRPARAGGFRVESGDLGPFWVPQPPNSCKSPGV